MNVKRRSLTQYIIRSLSLSLTHSLTHPLSLSNIYLYTKTVLTTLFKISLFKMNVKRRSLTQYIIRSLTHSLTHPLSLSNI
jgi:hypothetical protein